MRDLVGYAVLVLLCGCATTEAVMHAPEEFWITVDSILAALWKDVLDFINLIL